MAGLKAGPWASRRAVQRDDPWAEMTAVHLVEKLAVCWAVLWVGKSAVARVLQSADLTAGLWASRRAAKKVVP